MLSHDELEVMASSYVLLALEPEEREAFQEHLNNCDICLRRVAEMDAVAANLALAVQEREPSPQLRTQILAQVRTERTGAHVAPVKRRMPSAGRLRKLARPAALAAATGILLLLIAGLALRMLNIQESLESSQRRASRGYEAITIMSRADRWWKLEATAAAPDAAGTLAYSTELSEASIVIFNLPSAAKGKAYHAWAVKSGVSTNIGNLWPLSDDLWRLIPVDLEKLDAITITLEDGREASEQVGTIVATVTLTSD
ncbi:MAG: anti-sigma factor [Chloroflexi bacterium]|nr:anti-sigma factor [Chloroflexota bacterium]MCI0797108.1 anti-sigma factor [Chloroflexota bacterium]